MLPVNRPLDADVRPPGSKSLTNRYLACAALADGSSTIRGASLADDAWRMIAALRALGIDIRVREEANELEVTGCRGLIPADAAELDLGAAGTAFRFMTALASLGRGRFRLDGSARMRERPIGALVDGLTALGAGIGYELTPGFPPVTMHARGLAGGNVEINSPVSSQFLSALFMVAPYATDDVFVSVIGEVPSRPYLDMTVAVMRSMGVEVLERDGRFVVASGQRYRAGAFDVEPDASAASYFWAAAAMAGGSVRVRGLNRGSTQGDIGFVDVLERMGCSVEAGNDFLGVRREPATTLRGIEIDLNGMPDTVQTLAVTALFAAGPTTIRGAANLRVKETDRLAALERELVGLGAGVELLPDGLRVHPPAEIRPAQIETYDDHRMAMSFALAGLVAEGVVIRDAGCVSKSYPDFFEAIDYL